MRAEKLIRQILEQLGGPAVLEKAGGTRYPIQAVIQPVHDRSRLYLEEDRGTFGTLSRSHAIYYGPAWGDGLLAEEGDLLEWNGEHWLIKHREPFYLKGKPLYLWAVLQKAAKEADDGTAH